MMSPAALVYNQSLVAGNQLVNRLHDMGYRVHTTSDLEALPNLAAQLKPMIFFAGLGSKPTEVLRAIRSLKSSSDTTHIAIIGTLAADDPDLAESARAAGASLIASEGALLVQLPQLIEHALEV